MSNFREITRHAHDEAENTHWGKLLASGNISRKQYVHYLYNLLEIHQAIESRNLIDKPQILRVEKIINDIEAIDTETSPIVLNTTWEYIEHLRNLTENQLWSHIYCHYLGYMYGGQMIKKAISYPTSMLDFDDKPSCVAYIREHLENADEREAVLAFKWATKLFNDLWDNYKDEK